MHWNMFLQPEEPFVQNESHSMTMPLSYKTSRYRGRTAKGWSETKKSALI